MLRGRAGGKSEEKSKEPAPRNSSGTRTARGTPFAFQGKPFGAQDKPALWKCSFDARWDAESGAIWLVLGGDRRKFERTQSRSGQGLDVVARSSFGRRLKPTPLKGSCVVLRRAQREDGANPRAARAGTPCRAPTAERENDAGLGAWLGRFCAAGYWWHSVIS
jgi:hypothetical protein